MCCLFIWPRHRQLPLPPHHVAGSITRAAAATGLPAVSCRTRAVLMPPRARAAAYCPPDSSSPTVSSSLRHSVGLSAPSYPRAKTRRRARRTAASPSVAGCRAASSARRRTSRPPRRRAARRTARHQTTVTLSVGTRRSSACRRFASLGAWSWSSAAGGRAPNGIAAAPIIERSEASLLRRSRARWLLFSSAAAAAAAHFAALLPLPRPQLQLDRRRHCQQREPQERATRLHARVRHHGRVAALARAAAAAAAAA